jgi:branched-chain amino acid aminotransferase
MSGWVYMHPDFVAAAEAKVSVRTHAFNYGTSVFEGMRAYWSAGDQRLLGFRLGDHFERLTCSAKLLCIALPGDVEWLVALARELLHRNEYRQDVYIRPIAYKGEPVRLGVALTDAADAFCMYSFPLDRYLDTARALRVRVASWHRIPDGAIPARAKIGGGYVNAALAKTEALRDGYDECLMLSGRGTVAEGSTENLFALLDGTLVTPPVSEDLLVGITRSTVLTLAREELGLTVAERPLARSELYGAEEAFLCGTGAEVAAIGEIDGRAVGSGGVGPVTLKLQELYRAAVHGDLAPYRGWCTPV